MEEEEIATIEEDNEEEIITIEEDGEAEITTIEEDFPSGGTDNYEYLRNKPKINNVELKDNKTSKDLKLQDVMKEFTNIELEAMFSDL